MNELAKRNDVIRRQTEDLREVVIAKRRASPSPQMSEYPLLRLKSQITRMLEARSGRLGLSPQIDSVDRGQFGGDLVIKVPLLFSEGGARGYIQKHVPWIAETLRQPELSEAIAVVETSGIYVNVRLTDRWLLESAQVVVDLNESFGLTNTEESRTFIVDYSSPNVAKVLHAGHVRSTIIGHVLSNLHEACGALVYRINHINDFGGFGFYLEGYRRFGNRFPDEMRNYGRLLEIYAIRRTLERCIGAKTELEAMPVADREVIIRYFPEVISTAALQEAYSDFVRKSNARFELLETGDAAEVELWSSMVTWSLTEFREFYDLLGIHIDFTLGESFYFEAGNALVERCLAAGTALVFTESIAREEITKLDRLVLESSITTAERNERAASLEKDIGAVVVRLPNGERLVVRRADGRSIYATRDLGAIEVRRQLFSPTDILYVVGQEQQVHFSRLFQAAEVLGLVSPGEVAFMHIYFGFYVDASTRKKLSSRESVANVNHLLAASIEHFRAMCVERGDMIGEELDSAAHQLAVGSLVFNDLKQDMKGSVDVAVGDLSATIAAFEQAGGAYVVYSACRARGILRKYGRPIPHLRDIGPFEINDQEATLLLKMQDIPERVAKAAAKNDPAILVRHLLDIAMIYNSYYFRSPVLKGGEGGEAMSSRLLITKAVQHALTNGLRLCHVECPPKI